MTRIAVTNLSDYNNGKLNYQWLDLPCTTEELEECVEAIGSPDEYFISDFECDFMKIEEYDNIMEISDQIEEYDSLEDYDKKKMAFLLDMQGYDFDAALSNLEDCDCYEGMTMVGLAEDFVSEGLFGEIPESIENYIDYEAIARDLEMDYTEYNGDIFRSN